MDRIHSEGSYEQHSLHLFWNNTHRTMDCGFRPSFRPSDVTTYSSHIMCCSYLPGRPVTVTSSPGLRLSLFHPARIISDGGRISACHWSTLPLSSFTATERIEWGLAHSYPVTTPLSVMLLFSYT